MLQVLVESGAMRPRRASWTGASLVVHCAVVAAAVALTAQVAPDAPAAPRAEEVIYVAPPPAPAASPVPIGAIAPLVISRPSFAIPTVVPPAINAPSTDFFNRVNEDLARMVVGSPIGTRSGNSILPGGIHTAETVDRVVAPWPDNPAPVFPRRLSSAGVEGDVIVRFVVDTTGRVESGSVEIESASHPAFADAVQQWLTRTRYAPALAGGRPVRQLVRQRVGFTITR